VQTIDLALVSELDPSVLPISELLGVSAALQKQIRRDVAPRWNVSASVDAFVSLDQLPPGHWPIYICEDIGLDGTEGIHKLPDNCQPYALVQFKDYWSLTASHEAIEMLIDPQGNRQLQGPSPRSGEGEVMFLVEVCDPVYNFDCGYLIDDYPVSDFCTPQFYDSINSGVYDITGHIQTPLNVAAGGYISYRNPSNGQWCRWSKFTDDPNGEYLPLGTDPDLSALDIRTWIDSCTPQRLQSLVPGEAWRKKLKTRKEILERKTVGATRLREQIQKLTSRKKENKESNQERGEKLT
jgi:hypothetical protein